MTEDQNSEFGKGYAYCLGLFLAHAERIGRYKKTGIIDAGGWFNGAADHFCDLQIPEIFSDDVRDRVASFVEKCIRFRCYGEPTWEDAASAVQTAKDLLLEWDSKCGIPCRRGDFE